MKIIHSISAMQTWSLNQRTKNKCIALVPTMGALHEGHLSLIRQAKKLADFVVVSIFVNPTQFGPKEDFSSYPRPFQKDKKLCAIEDVDVLFVPKPEDMYSSAHTTWITEDSLSSKLCGLSRPGHFRGVCTVVLKLLNIVLPNVAIFGQKDAQQALIIKRMQKDLNIPTKIVLHPIVREKDGLAMSSRNAYLSTEERKQALVINQALKQAKFHIKSGKTEKEVKVLLTKEISSMPLAKIDYIEMVDKETLNPIKKFIRGKTLIAVAVFFGKTRLIDNVIL